MQELSTLTYSTTNQNCACRYRTFQAHQMALRLVIVANVNLSYCTAIVVGEHIKAARQIGHAGKVTCNICLVVIQTAPLQQDFAFLKLTLCCVGSRDNCSDHFTNLLPLLVPTWTHTDAMMGAQYLTQCHLHVLGFEPVPRKHHLASLFGVDLSSSQTTRVN